MAIKLQCPCGKALSVKDEFAGRRVKCPACQTPLQVPKPKVEEESFGDDWDLGDSADQDFDDEPTETRAKSRGGKSPAKRGPTSRQTSMKAKGNKPKQSSRGVLIAVSAGGGLLVIALLVWMFWPAKPGSDVADALAQNTAGSASTTGGETSSSANTASVDPGSQANVGAANPVAQTAGTATKLEGDLNLLQGTWQVADVAVDADQQGAADVIAQAKQTTWTIKGDVLTMLIPDGALLSSIKLDSTRELKGIDLIPLDGRGRKTSLGIYSLAGDSWTLCLSFNGAVRPTEMKPDKSLGYMVLTLKKGTGPAIGNSTAATSAAQFDYEAWQQASGRLQAMKVNASLERWEQFGGTGGPTHVVMFSPPETADGTMSPELWAIVSSISHVAPRTTFATDATLRQLAQHPGLLGVNMSTRSTVTADGIHALKACPQLQSFFCFIPVSPELCEAISQLGHLRSLGINDGPVSEDMLRSIVRLSRLEFLSLQNTGVTDDGAVQIQTLTELRTLFLNKSQMTDQGLRALTSLTNLEKLSIEESKVTDQGLKSLESLHGLKVLYVRGLNVTPQAMAELEASLPNCQVLK